MDYSHSLLYQESLFVKRGFFFEYAKKPTNFSGWKQNPRPTEMLSQIMDRFKTKIVI